MTQFYFGEKIKSIGYYNLFVIVLTNNGYVYKCNSGSCKNNKNEKLNIKNVINIFCYSTFILCQTFNESIKLISVI